MSKHACMLSCHCMYHSMQRTTLKSTVILLPLLGVTWVVGIFAVSENTTVFAWLFTILNSLQVCTVITRTTLQTSLIIIVSHIFLQGVLIFLFHVIKNTKVCTKETYKYSSYNLSHLMNSTYNRSKTSFDVYKNHVCNDCVHKGESLGTRLFPSTYYHCM